MKQKPMQVSKRFSGWMAVVLAFSAMAYAQDVNVAGNLKLGFSTPNSGNILKSGVPFLHDFGPNKVICKGTLYCVQTGSSNTFVGRYAGNLTMTGDTNTSVGYSSLFQNTSGGSNTAAGYLALSSNGAGNYNTAAGALALANNQAGVDNTAGGYQALYSNLNGNGNTATGRQALYSNTSGTQNSALGYYALWSNQSGYSNTAIGNYALYNNTTGQSNTAIGSYADVLYGAPLTNATAIGYGAVVDASNKIVLGNAEVTLVQTSGGVSAGGDVVAGGKVAATGDIVTGSNIVAAYRVIAGHGFTGSCSLWYVSSTIGAPVTCDMFDVAETLGSLEPTEPGDVLIVSEQKSSAVLAVRKSIKPYDDLLLGVVSTNPGVVLDGNEAHVAGDSGKFIAASKTVLALAGRVPVKVSMENGPIRIGDPLTSSSTPGVAMKATRSGKILGYALQSSSRNGKVLLFVQPGYYALPDLQHLHAENAALRAKMRKLSQDNHELRAAVQHSQHQLEGLLQQVETISRKLNSTTLAEMKP